MPLKESTGRTEPGRGLVRRRRATLPFDVARFAPSRELSPFVERYWRASWDLGDHRHDQEVLASAAVGVVVDTGSDSRSGVWGPVTGVFVRSLSGSGRAFGIRFRPGAFRAFFPGSLAQLTDCSQSIAAVFGVSGECYERLQIEAYDDAALLANAEAFLSALEPSEADAGWKIRRALELLEASDIRTASALADAMEMSLRSLQRLFHEELGVPPKWSIKRLRFQQALDRLHSGEKVDLATLAHDLGYFDQAHFNREFRAVMGCSPSAYRGQP